VANTPTQERQRKILSLPELWAKKRGACVCSCGLQLGWKDGKPEEEEVEYLGDDVAGGEGEDVGAGDLVGALGVSR